MTHKETESIIDIINQLSKEVSEIISMPLDGPNKFSKIKHYLGHYCGNPEPQKLTLDNVTINNCTKHIQTSPDGYYIAIEFFDIDTEPILEFAEQLEEQDCKSEASMLLNVHYFVKGVQQWANDRTSNIAEHHFERPIQKENAGSTITSHEEFLALFDLKKTSQHKANLLLNHIIEVSKEKNVHTYYGALIQECTFWFKYKEQDFSNLLRKFLEVAGLDANLSQNVRRTKLGKKATERAKKKIAEITSSRKRN